MPVQRKHFIRKKENFICDTCDTPVRGTGYTNHCPECLFSKHVDKDLPGDRQSKCQGLMEPINLELKHNQQYLIHHCQKCGKTSRNKTSPEDNFEKLLAITKKH